MNRGITRVCLVVWLGAAAIVWAEPVTLHFQANATQAGKVHDAGANPHNAADRLRIDFVDVGQGDCILLTCPKGGHVMVDCGSLGGGDREAAKQRVQAILAEGNGKVDTLVITHPDADHYNWIPYVLDGVDVDAIYMVGKSSEYKAKPGRGRNAGESGTKWLDERASAVEQLNMDSIDSADGPRSLCGCDGVQSYVLAADTADVESDSPKNTRSIVLKVTYRDFDIMLAGDATTDTETAILNAYPAGWLDCDVLKVGHHGSLKTSTGTAWAGTVRPEVAIVCAALVNSFEHPSATVVRRLQKSAVTTPPHPLRVYGKSDDAADTTSRDAVFSTASDKSMTLVTNGAWYDLTYERP